MSERRAAPAAGTAAARLTRALVWRAPASRDRARLGRCLGRPGSGEPTTLVRLACSAAGPAAESGAAADDRAKGVQ